MDEVKAAAERRSTYIRLGFGDESDYITTGQAADGACAERLRALLPDAKYKREFVSGRGTPCESWQVRCSCGGRSRRLNLVISLAQRAEGILDQLVAVEDNDARRQWSRR